MDPLKHVAALAPTKKAFSLWEEFKNFAFKGNVIDLAVGVVIGTAFSKIIASLVGDIIMPLLGLVLPGEKGYDGWVLPVRGATIPYGKFIGEIVNFLVISIVLFIFIVKFLGWIMSFKKQEATAPAPLTKDQELLTEIRDLLKNSQTA